MNKLVKALLVIVICIIAVFIAFTILAVLFMGKYLEQYNEWEDV